jgi:hypothetical protein
MPSGAIHNEQGDGARTDAFTDFNQMLVHGLDVDGRQNQSAADASGRTDRAEKIRPVEAPVARRARAASEPGPDVGQRALLPDPRFILEPDFDKFANVLAKRLFC